MVDVARVGAVVIDSDHNVGVGGASGLVANGHRSMARAVARRGCGTRGVLGATFRGGRDDIARVVDVPALVLDVIAAVAAMLIADHARAPMFAGREGDLPDRDYSRHPATKRPNGPWLPRGQNP